MNYQQQYELWRKKVSESDPLYQELLAIEHDEQEKKERFYQTLTFGTAGLRGKVGAGTNRMNFYTVGQATQGIANTISSYGQSAKDQGVVIAHDPRHFSKEFCRFSACIFAANGIKAYIFKDLRPTPQLAYMIGVLKTTAGINITASHNPKDYNGYKAYWSDGCQVSSKIADQMMHDIEQVDLFSDVKTMDYHQAIDQGLITILDESYDRMYLDEIEKLSIHHGDELDLDIPIVYTPLNGAGSKPFAQMLTDLGYRNWKIVPEQKDPDPNFTSVGYPNPEDPKAFALAEQYGKQMHATLLMATDPDSDRFAIEILGPDGTYIPLNGNQTGYLLVQYILEGKKDAGTLPENGAMVKSIVTSTLSSKIAESYGVTMFESLTGFKNICGMIPYVTEKGYTYIFGYEESVGYAACPIIRDKDGISAGMLVAEAAAYYQKQGKTLYDVLQEIYAKFGYYHEDEPNLVLEGIEGANRIARMMVYVRDHLFTEVAGLKVVKVIDYQNGYEHIGPSNVLRFYLENGSWFAIRPSGTEPKIKFYFYATSDSLDHAKTLNQQIKQAVMDVVLEVK